jgi:hypothetical protein
MVVAIPRAIVTRAPKQFEVDFQSCEKHQQELPQLRQEISDRSDLAKDVENVRPDYDAANQQPYYCRNM